MSVGTPIQVDGLKETTAAFRKVENGLKDLKAVAKASAEIVADEARTLVPVRTGRLQKKIKAGGTQKGGTIKVGGLEYHRIIHFGWPGHNISPQPFMYEALDNRRDEVIEKYNKEINNLISKSFDGGV